MTNENNLINLKCIDDFNNRFLLLLKVNMNNLLEVLKIDYEIDLPESKIFENYYKNKNIEENNKTYNTFDPFE
tara:strand:+ start:98 stop:316 length:219 start_codon:yes stop_codon:yes gene_type:complete